MFNSNGSLGSGGRHSGQAPQQLLLSVYSKLWDIEISQVSKVASLWHCPAKLLGLLGFSPRSFFLKILVSFCQRARYTINSGQACTVRLLLGTESSYTNIKSANMFGIELVLRCGNRHNDFMTILVTSAIDDFFGWLYYG
jgi:hypothetical protein